MLLKQFKVVAELNQESLPKALLHLLHAVLRCYMHARQPSGSRGNNLALSPSTLRRLGMENFKPIFWSRLSLLHLFGAIAIRLATLLDRLLNLTVQFLRPLILTARIGRDMRGAVSIARLKWDIYVVVIFNTPCFICNEVDELAVQLKANI